ncbi:hypothetical protein R3P38DRAFT_3186861 [Favolaschia claudopus]|uniref:F-box domain-containing protein n=1 Tax=Favolaschia claudopus TaxID=2862362 RepID=A0AAW0C5E1_9AGAR
MSASPGSSVPSDPANSVVVVPASSSSIDRTPFDIGRKRICAFVGSLPASIAVDDSLEAATGFVAYSPCSAPTKTPPEAVITPVHVLPAEVLARALRFSFLGPRFFIRDPSYRRKVVGSACHFWAAVIDSDPQSWSYIVVDHTTSLVFLRDALTKSAATPLTLELDCRLQGRPMREFLDRVLPEILPVFPRCRELLVRAAHADTCLHLMGRLKTCLLPMLVTARFDLALPMVPFSPSVPGAAVPFLAGGQLPLISRVSFTHGFPSWAWTQIASTLTVVRLARMNHIVIPRLKLLHDFLRSCTNLVFLAIHYVDAAPPPTADRGSPYVGGTVSLPHLRRLDLSVNMRRTVFIVSSLKAPLLEHMSLAVSDEVVLRHLVLHAGHLLLQITVLRLAVNFSSYLPLEVLLRSMSRLDKLDARPSSPTFVDCLHHSALFATTMATSLRCIATNEFPFPLLQDVLAFRHWTNFRQELCLVVPGVDETLPPSTLSVCRLKGDTVVVGEHVDYVDWMDDSPYPVL